MTFYLPKSECRNNKIYIDINHQQSSCIYIKGQKMTCPTYHMSRQSNASCKDPKIKKMLDGFKIPAAGEAGKKNAQDLG